MNGLRAAVAAETLKARRSIAPAMTLVAMTLLGGVAGLFMLILQDPDRARRLGLLGAKASLTGLTADWAGLLAFLAQAVAVGDLLLFAFIAAWVFGRESADNTMRYLLALPVPRSTVVVAKFCVVAGWAVLANVWLTVLVLGIGRLLGLPGGSSDVVLTDLRTVGVSAGLALLATTPVALVASAGRGYLAPLAYAVGGVILAQVASVLGWGGVTPWSVPAVAAGLAPGVALTTASLVVVLVTAAGGVAGTLAWWRGGRAGA